MAIQDQQPQSIDDFLRSMSDLVDPPEGTENTETRGGTRYSSGKPVQCWTPWGGIVSILAFARTLHQYGVAHVPQLLGIGSPEDVLFNAWQSLAKALGDPLNATDIFGQRVTALDRAGYKLMLLLHHFEEGTEVMSTDSVVPALGAMEVCRVSEHGAEKYAPLDWELGQSYSTLLSSANRHMLRALTYGPYTRDPESGLLHIAHALWNIACLLHFHKAGRDEELDDVTPHQGVSA